ncbi:hypothetical protein IFM89_000199 [Coptis chinensis]|uniref:F-box protein At3g26010-like beta-propeller domain-containing protein n=1 Tax=Coptis chinensis TaxID=261450 RepID=A0A835I736_9MAGN|nr:hypothetical protein IFM89_000199 [Coptis chinensis]
MKEGDQKKLGVISFDESLTFLLGTANSNQSDREVVFIVASSNGFILYRSGRSSRNHYYVCNPITKQQVALPKPPNMGWDDCVLKDLYVKATNTHA